MAEADTEEPQIKTIEEYHERAPRRWPLLLGYIIAALIVAAIVVFGARAIYHHYHKPAVKAVPVSVKVVRPGSTTKGSTGSSSKSSPSSSNNSQTTGSNLPNSGPGQVAAIFISSSAAAAGAHYLISRQRKKQT